MAEKKLLLFDPISCRREITTYKELCAMLKSSRPNIVHNYTHRIKLTKINCYIVDVDTPSSELSELLAKEVIKGELWKNIDGANIEWQVSNYGRYRHRRSKKGKWVYPVINLDKYGYAIIQISIDGKCKKMRAQHFVAHYFLGPKPSKKHCIRKHIQDRYNNRAENLYYGLITDMLKATHKGCYGVVFKISPETGKIVEEYENLADAAKSNFTTKSNIRDAATGYGSRVTAVGYIWAFEKDYKGILEFEEEIENE